MKICVDDLIKEAKRMHTELKIFEFKLTEEDFNDIIQNDCYLCGKKNSKTHQNGIDRMDNTKGYTLSNCKSCCSTCNYLKYNYKLKDFLMKLMQIYDNKICPPTKIKNQEFQLVRTKEFYEKFITKHENIYNNITNS